MRINLKNGAALAAAGMLFVASGAVYAQNNGNNMNNMSSTAAHMSSQDRTFAREAAQGDLAEIELAKLAEQKSNNATVKQFAQKLVTDHTQNNDKLKQIAQQENLTLPTTMSQKDQTLKSQLESRSGNDFDRDYISHMITDHEHDIKAFQKEANSGTNPELKNFASQTVPVLQEHLKLAKEAEQQLKSSGNWNGNSNK